MTYKGVRKLLTKAARELDVEAVVEGTVLRSGDRVRITAQLIGTSVFANTQTTDLAEELYAI
jgi:TolB-like protein